MSEAVATEAPIVLARWEALSLLERGKLLIWRPVEPQPGAPVTDAVPRRLIPHGPPTKEWYWRPAFGHMNPIPNEGWDFACPWGGPGDKIWVQEVWSTYERPEDLVDGIKFQADDGFIPIGNTRAAAEAWGEAATTEWTPFVPIGNSGLTVRSGKPDGSGKRWRNPEDMPRWASRFSLEVTGLRVDKIQVLAHWRSGAECWRASGISECLMPATGDHPDMVGYMLGPDDGKTGLEKYPWEAFMKQWDTTYGDPSLQWAANPYAWGIEVKRVDTLGCSE